MNHPDHRHIPFPLDAITGITVVIRVIAVKRDLVRLAG
jgi:hypothetical protein